MGRPDVARIKRDADVAAAEADRDTAIKRAEATRASAIAKAQADQERVLAETLSMAKQAEAQRDLEIKKAQYVEIVKRQQAQADKAYEIQTNVMQQQVTAEAVKVQQIEREQQIKVQEAEIIRVEKELIATVLKQAEVERKRIETLASAEKLRLTVEAEGQAAATRARGDAEADIIFKKGDAEARAMNVKAEAFQEYNQAAVVDKLLTGMPQIVAALAAPLSQVDKITIVSTGNGDAAGAHKITGDITKMAAQVPALFEALSGMQLSDLMSKSARLATRRPSRRTRWGPSAFSRSDDAALKGPRYTIGFVARPFQGRGRTKMGLLERVSTLVKANLNDLIDKAENPSKMIKQVILDMENQLLQVKTQVAISIADQHMLEKKEKEHDEKAAEWLRKAELAVDRGQDDLARAALERQKASERTVDSFRQQVADQRAQVTTLKAALGKLEQKLAEAQAKSETLLVQHRRARALGKASDAQIGIGDRSSIRTFDRMKEKVQPGGSRQPGQGRARERQSRGSLHAAGTRRRSRSAAGGAEGEAGSDRLAESTWRNHRRPEVAQAFRPANGRRAALKGCATFISQRACCGLLLRCRFRRFPVIVEELHDRRQVRADDVAVQTAGDLDVLVLDPQLLQLRHHRPRPADGDRRIRVAVHDDLGNAPQLLQVAGLPFPEIGAIAAQMSGYFGATFHVPMPPIEWPIR
jgi:phage shock protein A